MLFKRVVCEIPMRSELCMYVVCTCCTNRKSRSGKAALVWRFTLMFGYPHTFMCCAHSSYGSSTYIFFRSVHKYLLSWTRHFKLSTDICCDAALEPPPHETQGICMYILPVGHPRFRCANTSWRMLFPTRRTAPSQTTTQPTPTKPPNHPTTAVNR